MKHDMNQLYSEWKREQREEDRFDLAALCVFIAVLVVLGVIL